MRDYSRRVDLIRTSHIEGITRGFDVLQDKAIKKQLRSYVLFRERGRAFYQEATNELFRLHSRFQHLIKVVRVPMGTGFVSRWGNGLSGEGFQLIPVCDAEKMRASTGFLNEYVDNLSRIGLLIIFTEGSGRNIWKISRPPWRRGSALQQLQGHRSRFILQVNDRFWPH